ncbi:PAS domain S-box protein [Natronomonas sp. LN261]|uniref:PAS domain S-box protein n=1 Tax=Natronomonas sp. LN261 TaxID=2750669 RepID=UPI0015EF7A9E|nr:PAS domain S-box protein [Natronomonas sp. LN261]
MTDDTPVGGQEVISASELQTVFDSIHDAIIIHDREGNVVEANQAATDMYGYSRAELRNEEVVTPSSGNPPYTQENARKRIERAVEGENQTFEWQGRDSDGNVFWEEVSLARTAVGGEVRVIAIIRDIDDRKEAERRFETLIDNLPGIVYRCRTGPGWPMIFVGGQSEELTGYRTETIESGDVSWGDDLVHPDDRERIREAVESAAAADEPFEFTYRIRAADGETRWVWERGQHVDVPRRPMAVLEGFITDVTERKRYEQQLKEQRDSLGVLNQVVRHDIRNDMTVARGRANLLEAHVEEEGHADLEAIQEATENAIELTKTARDLSRTMLSTEADVGPVRLDRHLRASIEDVRSKFDGAVVSVDDPIPDVRVRGNDLLEAVFRNLIQNGIVHNDKEVPEVRVSVMHTDGEVTVTIEDNGPGIPDNRKEVIFGKGEKGLDSPGAGIGLYLVRTLVDQYGGDVRVEDADPDGAVFVVSLIAE